jgi:hypothetical protein
MKRRIKKNKTKKKLGRMVPPQIDQKRLGPLIASVVQWKEESI